MKTILFILAGIITTAFLGSCYYDKAELLYPESKLPCDTTAVATYSTDVAPVMSASCNMSGCHNTTDASAGVILDTYAGVKIQALNGRLVGSTSATGTMPKGANKLANCTLAKIQKWIDSGTPNN